MRADRIEHLDRAKRTDSATFAGGEGIDLSNALDPDIGPVASGDYSALADKADRVMNDIEHGTYVSKSQIDDALFVPPKSLSIQQRAQLVQQLRETRNLDNQGWRDWTWDPVVAQDFWCRGEKANRAIKDLETQQEVSWSEIHEGLEVPRYP